MATPPNLSLLEAWSITAEDLSEIVSENPSMRGLMFGFVAEYKLKRLWLMRPEIENLVRPRFSDRKQKCDFRFDYKGTDIRVEVKCLDTPKVREVPGGYEGTFQCNASDTTEVTLPDGETVNTNCLVVGGFDLLAVCLYSFGNSWRFAFALNDDLPRSTWRKYTPEQQRYLLPSSMKISWPLRAPFADSPFGLLDRLLAERTGG
ncbi:MAG: hypothetical protein ABSD43_09535 [Terracidiphilus sp.]|jgi:hypothetical protein